MQPGSTGDKLGLHAEDTLISINDREIHDVIDYRYLVADEHIELVVRPKGGKSLTLSFPKDPDDNLGLDFAQFPIKRCRNKCIFCFVDQMPGGCRKSLYIKDDDFRASFLYGNYITLGALSESDWERIFRERLSPLYISVHATDPNVRSFILGNRRSPDILTSMKRLADHGITMHAQIVLCPGINDGEVLKRSLLDLSALFPAVASIALVPVGLTNQRSNLFPLRSFTRTEGREVVHTANVFGSSFRKRFGTRLVFSSDEFFIKAGLSFPLASYYEDFPQIENGVGMVARFLRGVKQAKALGRIEKLSMTIITGVSFNKILKPIIEHINKNTGAHIRVLAAKNHFFGSSVSVAGLLTGQDIIKAAQGRRLGEVLAIPAAALKDTEDVFLDDMSLDQVQKTLSLPVIKVEQFSDITSLLRKRGMRRHG